MSYDAPCVTTYHPAVNNLKQTLMKQWSLIQNRPNRLTLDRWSRDLNWVLDQNKHRALARGDMSIFHHAAPHFCCAGKCENSSEKNRDLSFHSLPPDNKPLLKLWIKKMHRDPRYFNVNKHVKICSEHFRQRDFVNPHAKKRRLNRNAVPSKFSWTPVKEEEEEDVERTAVSKLERSRIEQNEATDTASEGEGDELRVSGLTLTSQKTQTYEDDFCDDSIDISFRVPCLHRFSLSHLLSKSTTPSKEEKMFSHFTGFDSYAGFMDTLKFILPNLDRKLLIYWDSTAGKSSVIDTEKLFEENESDLEEDRDEDEPEIRETKTRPSAHKLQVEDEFLMVLMKHRMGLSNIALGERFNLSDSAVNNILLTWLNYIYEVLGSLKIWPHRDVILKNAPQEFIDKYPNNTVIIDATELKIQISNANTWLQ